MVHLQEASDGVLEIFANDTLVGYIETTQNTITQIDVFPEHRKNGYATEALQLYLQKKQQEGYEKVTTTTVVSGTFERILLDAGFNSTEDENANKFVFSFN